MKTLVIGLALLWCGVALGEPPVAKIHGPTEAVPGDFIDLDTSESVAEKFLWVVEPSMTSNGKKTFRVSSDGRVCSLASFPGRYRVLLVVSNSDGPAVAWHDVVVTGSTVVPKPNDPVTPTPSPVNPLPVGKYDLAETTRQAIVSASGLDLKLCGQWALNFKAVSLKLSQGKYKTVAEANADLKSRNDVLATQTNGAWDKPVNTKIRDKLKALVADGKLSLTNLSDLATAYDEIATGYIAAGN